MSCISPENACWGLETYPATRMVPTVIVSFVLAMVDAICYLVARKTNGLVSRAQNQIVKMVRRERTVTTKISMNGQEERRTHARV